MNLDIRLNIKNNLKNENVNGIISIIDDSVNKNDELVLPGLGVILELFWSELNQIEKEKISNIIIRKIS